MNGIRRRSFAWAALAAIGAFGSGCGGGGDATGGPGSAGGTQPSDPDGPKLVFISNTNSDWWSAVEKGMEDGGSEFGAQVSLRRNDGQPQGQIDKLREVLSMPDVQGVAVSVIEADSPGVIDAMKELREAGKVVITIDSDVDPEFADARRAYIGTNNSEAGRVAGETLALLRPEGGKAAVFVGVASAANARAREGGLLEAAGEGFEKTQTWEDGGDHAKARQNVQSAISKTPDLGALVGLWSYNAPAIAEEVANSPQVRDRVTVVTFDLDEAARPHIAGGNIDASVCQNPYEIGRMGVQLLTALIGQDEATVSELLPDGDTREIGVRVIVPAADSPASKMAERGQEVLTIDEMNSWLESKGLRSS
ncbi:substrate-binding domain-containing protein [Tautonia plasticadhaerens]|uniref:D-allose-binding periplasmic protein n=1 Tax=Tautonia plasticadhaerens TaxID=2527974 RepID=A0A518GYX5_9BACT|nr:substrate-binding domain-containing protein [Tautonia plasticadhaerens]QDV33798.1 D-allose-binding periplasmic protein precursor [Tautonia plasticadhaerens]